MASLFWARAAPERIRSSTQQPWRDADLLALVVEEEVNGGAGATLLVREGSKLQLSPPDLMQLTNPYEVIMPWFMEPIAETADLEDQSIIVINSVMIAWSLHSKRGWYRRSWPMRRVLSTCSPKETRSCLPAGYHVSLFGNYTLDGIKVVAPRHPG